MTTKAERIAEVKLQSVYDLFQGDGEQPIGEFRAPYLAKIKLIEGEAE